MAIGKNKRLSKRKGNKKKIVDPFTKKEWYDVKAPSMFSVRDVGKTLVTRTTGMKIASDALKGRVYECALADLNDDENAFRKFKLICEDVQGKYCYTNFHGMDLTRDKVADSDRGSRRCQNHRWISPPSLLSWIHQEGQQADQESCLRQKFTGPSHQKEDGRHHDQRSLY